MSTDLDWIAKATGASSVRRGERIQSLWSGYGEVFRVHLHGASIETAIVKSVTPPPGRRTTDSVSHARKCRSYDVEAAFYRAFAARCDAACRVPTMIEVHASPERWLFLLEDLDAAGLPGRRHDPKPAEADACLAWLASFHARFLGAPPVGLWTTGTYWHLRTRKDELAAMDAEDLALKTAAPVLDRLLRAATFQTLVHGDAKPANFCFAPRGGGVAAVDFQYVGGGCGMKDVAYFLSGGSTGSSEIVEHRYLDAYFAHLRRALAARPDVAVDVGALEAEWRALYPIARADYHRFLAGWAKEHWRRDSHAKALTDAALRTLGDLPSPVRAGPGRT